MYVAVLRTCMDGLAGTYKLLHQIEDIPVFWYSYWADPLCPSFFTQTQLILSIQGLSWHRMWCLKWFRTQCTREKQTVSARQYAHANKHGEIIIHTNRKTVGFPLHFSSIFIKLAFPCCKKNPNYSYTNLREETKTHTTEREEKCIFFSLKL